MPRTKGGELYECKEEFVIDVDGASRAIKLGDRVREGHVLLATYPEHFQRLTVQYDIEDASDEPGVRRGER